MNPLITIEYSKYKHIMKTHNQIKIEVYTDFIKDLSKAIEVNNFEPQTKALLRFLIENYRMKIEKIEKEDL